MTAALSGLVPSGATRLNSNATSAKRRRRAAFLLSSTPTDSVEMQVDFTANQMCQTQPAHHQQQSTGSTALDVLGSVCAHVPLPTNLAPASANNVDDSSASDISTIDAGVSSPQPAAPLVGAATWADVVVHCVDWLTVMSRWPLTP